MKYPEFKMLADLKIVDSQNPEFKNFAYPNIFQSQNSEFKILLT